MACCHFVVIAPRHRDAPMSQPASAYRIPHLIGLYHGARERELVGLPCSDSLTRATFATEKAQI